MGGNSILYSNYLFIRFITKKDVEGEKDGSAWRKYLQIEKRGKGRAIRLQF